MSPVRDSSGRFVAGSGAVVTDTDRGYNKLLARMNELAKRPRGVFVGIRSDKGAETEPGEELNLAQIAAVNEFGTKDGHIPGRPFLQMTVDENVDRYGRKLLATSLDYLTGKRSLEAGLKELGVAAVADVRRTIGDKTKLLPNAPATIAKKTVAGKVGDSPLIDTGRLRASIDYEIRRIRD